jgi:phosphoribosylaminoimidazolecarboxamide formyltransferase / IMP cyclohydrolase
MTTIVPIRRALLSVSDKTGLVPFAQSLASMGVEIISTGGTAALLRESGLRVIPIDEVTGFPEMMDGRVKTLHPAIHGALLGRRDNLAHVDAMQRHGIAPIDLVCVNLYPFEQTVCMPGITENEAIEQIDIGGPSMLRSAAKNFMFVTVVTEAAQFDRVLAEMRAHDGATTLELRRELANAAFARTAAYDAAISAWMMRAGAAAAPSDGAFPPSLRLSYVHHADLRYGENPHQRAAVYAETRPSVEPSVIAARSLHGKPLSYNNLADAAAALALIQDLYALSVHGPAGGNEFRAAAAIIKHANPCGAAVSKSLPEAFELAYAGDPLAAYGGILAVNAEIDAAAAEVITEGRKFLEVIVAPGFDDEAMRMLAARWKSVRLLAVGPLTPRAPGMGVDERDDSAAAAALEYRSIPGGMLVQERDALRPRFASPHEKEPALPHGWTHAAGPMPTPPMVRDAGFAFVLAKHLRSNAIAIARGGQMIGAGMGQVDRVTSCRLAVERMGRATESPPRSSEPEAQNWPLPPVAASDAFFPFPDGPALLIDAGVRCIVHPGGSMRDDETLVLCNERDVTCLLTGVRHFRH